MNALFSAIPGIVNVVLVMLLFLLVFAVMGVSFYKGTFFQCFGLDDDILDFTIGQVCNNHGG